MNQGRYFSEVIKQQSLYKIVLELDNPQAADAGVYRLVAKNKNGSSETSVDFKPEDQKKPEEKKPDQKTKVEEKNEQNKASASPKTAPATFKDKPKDQVCLFFFFLEYFF